MENEKYNELKELLEKDLENLTNILDKIKNIYNLDIDSDTINGRIIEGTASNGLQFRGYIENGEVTSIFPVIPD